MANKNITTLITNSIPQFIRLEYPYFVEFIEAYYAQQEAQGSGYEFLANISDYMDIDRTSLDFLNNFSQQYLSAIPKSAIASIDKRVLIKNIKDYYQSLGSEASLKFIFRLLFNESLSIYYPSKDMLRVSDGKWQNDVIIKVTNSNLDDSIKALEGTEIIGETTGSRGLVEKVKIGTSTNELNYAELFLTEIDPVHSIFNFSADEYIKGVDFADVVAGAPLQYKFHESIISIITGVDITTSGMYYAAGDVVEVLSTQGADGFIIIDQVEKGEIEGLEIIKGGSDYAVNEYINFICSSGQSAKYIISAVDGSGAITEVQKVNHGYGYICLPQVVIASINGTGAVLYPYSSKIGKIKSTKIINHGVDYKSSGTGTFPLQFPIQFSESYITGQLIFPKVFFAYDDIWNSENYIVNEIIQGLSSGARARITRVDMLSGVFGYSLLTEVDFIEGEYIIGETSGASGFKVYEKFEAVGEIVHGAVGEYDGYYANTDGFLDSDKYIQDSYYYQVFSYVLNTTRPRSEWIDAIKGSAHPAGTIVFGFGDFEALEYGPSEGGWISPIHNTIEFYKFRWEPTLYDGNTMSEYSNTQNIHLRDYVISDITFYDHEDWSPLLYPDINDYKKSRLCYGSDVSFFYTYTGQRYEIDGGNSLLIDSLGNTLII